MDSKVQDFLNKIQNKVVELDALRESIISESISFAKEETDRFMKLAINANTSLIKDLGTSGLQPIKDQFNTIIDSLKPLTHKVLEDDNVWEYRFLIDLDKIKDLKRPNFSVSGNRLPDKLDEALRLLLSPIGSLLTKNKLDNSRNWKKKNGKYIYVYGLTITKGLLESAKIFSKKHKEYESLIDELKKADNEAEEQSTQNLWDSI